MSIRSGEVCIVRVCTEHFLSSGRAANAFSLSAASEGDFQQTHPCWVAPHKDGTHMWVLARPCLHMGWLWMCSCSPPAFSASHSVSPPQVIPHPGPLPTHPKSSLPSAGCGELAALGQQGCLCCARSSGRAVLQLGLPGKPGSRDSSEIQSEKCEVSGAVQVLPTRVPLSASEHWLLLSCDGKGGNGISLGFRELTWPGTSWLLCHTSFCQTCCS